MSLKYKPTLKELANHTFLLFRENFPIIENFLHIQYHCDSTVYNKNYVAHFDKNGRLEFLKSNPNYPEDFRRYDPDKKDLVDIMTQEDINKHLPSQSWYDNISKLIPLENLK